MTASYKENIYIVKEDIKPYKYENKFWKEKK